MKKKPKLPTHALTLLQPWLWLVLHAGKDVENRSWFSRFQGPVWLHASQALDPEEYARAEAFARRAGYLGAIPPLDELPTGAILGRTTILSCVPPLGGRFPWMGFPDLPWHMKEQYGYQLGPRIVLPTPVPARGMLNFWPVPEDVLAACAAVS